MKVTVVVRTCNRPEFLKEALVSIQLQTHNDWEVLIFDDSASDENISIYIAPEGTFNETNAPLGKFYDGAFRLAIETQTPIKPLLFLDAVDRLHWKNLMMMTPGKLRTVYLEEVSPEGYRLEDVALLRQKVYDLMETKIKQYQPSWIHPEA
jgi:1-acyl-sn-glycerol-3-phosphate acyltransferase